MRLFSYLTCVAVVVQCGLVACSDDASPAEAADAAPIDAEDASSGRDTEAVEDSPSAEDAPTTEDSPSADDTPLAEDAAGADTSPDLPPVTCDHSGFAIVDQVASGEAGFVEYVATSTEATSLDQLSIELLYDDIPQEAFSFSFYGENYKTCDTCVTIRTNTGCEGDDCVRKLFLVVAGQLEITNWHVPGTGEHFVGTLTDIEAVEVTLGEGMDFTSVPVEGGEGWCIESMAFDAELTHW